MIILADIGGTYARFGVHENGEIAHIKKYEAVKFDGLNDALVHYQNECRLDKVKKIRIATAAQEKSGLWTFINNNQWQIDPENLREQGWQVETIINDFEATAWSLLSLECGDAQTLRGGQGASDSYCVLGPGTGLGLAYVHNARSESPIVQKTHGGHLPIASLNDNHGKAIKMMRSKQDKAIVFENLVSGPGLKALRETLGEEDGLRLFHEFLGIFAASAVIAGHAYGGLYLTGGVIESLMNDDLFDINYFEKHFNINVAAPVHRDLSATPIIHITTPYPALKGLVTVRRQV